MYFVGLIHEFVVRNPSVTFTQKGDRLSEERYLAAEFRKGGAVPEYAREAVSRLPQFYRGLGMDEDPYTRVSWFDSLLAQQENGWTDEERKIVEDALVDGQGVYFVVADQPLLAPPWPAYDSLVAVGRRTADMVAEKILEKVVEDGYDPAYVLAYEEQHANRPYVVAALQGLVAPVEDDGDEVEAEEIVAA